MNMYHIIRLKSYSHTHTHTMNSKWASVFLLIFIDMIVYHKNWSIIEPVLVECLQFKVMFSRWNIILHTTIWVQHKTSVFSICIWFLKRFKVFHQQSSLQMFIVTHTHKTKNSYRNSLIPFGRSFFLSSFHSFIHSIGEYISRLDLFVSAFKCTKMNRIRCMVDSCEKCSVHSDVAI